MTGRKKGAGRGQGGQAEGSLGEVYSRKCCGREGWIKENMMQSAVYGEGGEEVREKAIIRAEMGDHGSK